MFLFIYVVVSQNPFNSASEQTKLISHSTYPYLTCNYVALAFLLQVEGTMILTLCKNLEQKGSQ